MQFGDREREYTLHLPPGYDGRERLPVILNLHGFTSNMDQQDTVSNLPEMAGERGYAVVTPQALAFVARRALALQERTGMLAALSLRVAAVAFKLRDRVRKAAASKLNSRASMRRVLFSPQRGDLCEI